MLVKPRTPLIGHMMVLYFKEIKRTDVASLFCLTSIKIFGNISLFFSYNMIVIGIFPCLTD